LGETQKAGHGLVGRDPDDGHAAVAQALELVRARVASAQDHARVHAAVAQVVQAPQAHLVVQGIVVAALDAGEGEEQALALGPGGVGQAGQEAAEVIVVEDPGAAVADDAQQAAAALLEGTGLQMRAVAQVPRGLQDLLTGLGLHPRIAAQRAADGAVGDAGGFGDGDDGGPLGLGHLSPGSGPARA
jgi:hypothetical protein